MAICDIKTRASEMDTPTVDFVGYFMNTSRVTVEWTRMLTIVLWYGKVEAASKLFGILEFL